MNLFRPGELRRKCRAAWSEVGSLGVLVHVGRSIGRNALRCGWSCDERAAGRTFAYAEGREAELVVDLLPGAKTLVFDARPYCHPERSQTVDVSANGVHLGRFEMTPSWNYYVARIPADAVRDGANTIRFRFAYAIVPSEVYEESSDHRSLAAAFSAVTVTDAGSPGFTPALAAAVSGSIAAERPSPSPRRVELRRSFLGTVPGGIAKHVRVREGQRLVFAHAVRLDRDPGEVPKAGPIDFRVTVRDDGGDSELYLATFDPVRNARHRRWFDADLDLSRFSGRDVEIRFEVSPPGCESIDALPIWSEPILTATAPEPHGPNVVLIALDALRADHVAAYGYPRPTTPAIDGLARTGTRFDAAIACAPAGGASVASILTGRFPSEHDGELGEIHRLRHATLAEALRRSGYRSAAFTSGGPVAAERGYARGFDTWLEDGPLETTFARATEWLEAHHAEPFFLFVHSDAIRPPFRRRRFVRYPPPSDRIDEWVGDPALVNATDWTVPEGQYAADLYDGSVRRVDDEVGGLVATLDRLGRRDDAIVIVVGTHGFDLWDHRALLDGHSLHDALVRVPLVVRGWDADAPRTISPPVSLVELMPSLLHRLRAQDGPGAGASGFAPLLAGDGAARRAGTCFSEGLLWGCERKSVRTDRHKYVRAFPDDRRRGVYDACLDATPEEELYDLEADPREQRNLAAIEPRMARRMRSLLDPFLARTGYRAPAAERAVEPALIGT